MNALQQIVFTRPTLVAIHQIEHGYWASIVTEYFPYLEFSLVDFNLYDDDEMGEYVLSIKYDDAESAEYVFRDNPNWTVKQVFYIDDDNHEERPVKPQSFFDGDITFTEQDLLDSFIRLTKEKLKTDRWLVNESVLKKLNDIADEHFTEMGIDPVELRTPNK